MKVWGTETEEFNDFSVFGEDAEDIKKEFDIFIENIEEIEDCVDAYRIAEAMDPEAMIAYDKLISCCGSTDIGKEINGTLYMFGANYGH